METSDQWEHCSPTEEETKLVQAKRNHQESSCKTQHLPSPIKVCFSLAGYNGFNMFLSLYSLFSHSTWAGPKSSRNLPWKKGSFYQWRSWTVLRIIQLHTASRIPQENSSPTLPVERWELAPQLNTKHTSVTKCLIILFVSLHPQRVAVSAVKSPAQLSTKQLIELLFSSQAIGHCKTTPTLQHGFLVQVKLK